MNIRETFESRETAFRREENKWERISFRYSVVRITAFVLVLFLIVFLANARQGLWLMTTLLLFPVVFAFLVRSHNRVMDKLRLSGNLRRINEEELKRLDHDLDGFRSGESWMDRSHPYAYDLDIFGRNSLFQLINRATTPSGEYHLAQWLLNPAPEETLIRRQEAVRELMPDLDWNQRFEAGGRLVTGTDQGDLNRLLNWLKEPANRPGLFYRLLSWLNPLLILLTVALTIAGMTTIYIPLLLLVFNGFILRKFMDRVMQVTDSTSGNARLLQSYTSLIGMMQDREFSSSLLRDIRQPFIREGKKATVTIHRLRVLADYLDARGNMFYQLLNFVFLLDIHLIEAAQRWKKRNHEDIASWFSNIGQTEALMSLAGLAFSRPDFTFPVFQSAVGMDFRDVGHPLIPPSERVVNDFAAEGSHVMVITGSNMSGKSTFLRTIGINAVLACAGAPVCASKATLTIFRIFTGMRSEDNLEEHISSFYAELKRIRQLLDFIDEPGAPVLFMLDEVLKGTNTKDRHAGSAALIRKLSAKKVMGFVSTHDLELGALAAEQDGIINYSFNSRISGSEIYFNYKISPGICHSFNASMLMKKIGILDDEN